MSRLRHFCIRLGAAARRSAQHRLIILWIVALGVPTVLFVTPVYLLLAKHLNHSIDSAAIAAHLDLRVLIDLPGVLFAFPEAVGAASVASILIGFASYAWLNGLAVGASRFKPNVSYSVLIAAANSQYWRMFRMGLWALVIVGIALAIASAAGSGIERADAEAVVASSLDTVKLLHNLFTLLLLALAQCSLEVGRAFLAIDPRRRSVIRSWWNGVAMLIRHPIRLIAAWLVPSLLSVLLSAALMLLRLNINQGGVIGLAAAFVIAELVVAWMAWMRITKLYALIDTVQEIRRL